MTSRSRTRLLLGVVLLTAALWGGWHYRHEIVALYRRAALPDAPSAAPGTTRFAVIGDYGMGTPYSGHVALMVDSWNPDFIATVGDNNYPKGAAETIDANIGQFYHGYIGSYRGRYGAGADMNRFFPSPGHVDWDTDQLAPYLEYFTLPGNERYYDLRRGPVHLFLLDTDPREPDGTDAGSVQGQWLRQGLADSDAPWKIVLAHHAPYTSHTVPDNHHMRWPFARWGADAVISGYYHVYERLRVNGIPYFVNGTGGTWTSHFAGTDPHSQFRYNGDLGAMVIDAAADSIVFRYLDRRGTPIDGLTLRKSATAADEGAGL
jgi:hypothetical protein